MHSEGRETNKGFSTGGFGGTVVVRHDEVVFV